MSSQSFRRPDFRLLLGYPDVTLTRTGATLPLGKTQAESPDFTEALRGFAAEVARARGRLVVVLPEIEVWRDRPVLAGRSLGARRRDAMAIGAEGLGMPLQAVAVVLGETAADGTTPVAAVRRGTLSETRALLARVGLRPAAIVGGGAFPGFATPPRLGGWPWRLPKMPRLPPRQFALGAGAVAAAAAMVLALPHGAPQPVPLPAQETAPAIELASAHVEPARAEPITPPALPRAAPPKHRPDNLAAPAPPQPIVTQATRNVPLVLTEPRRGEVPELRLAELSTARVRMTDAAMMTPLRRPAPTAGPGAAPELAAPAPKAASGPRPLPRPLTEAAAPTMPVPAVAAAVAATASRSPGAAPMPRPAARPPVPTLVVASLDPEALVAESIAAAAAAAMTRPAPGPLARPAGLKIPAKAGPAPKVVATRKAAPAPKVLAAPVRQASLAAAPAPQKARTATPKPVAAKPAAPKPVAAKPVAPKPVAAKPATPKPATTRGGLRRGNMALIGVFGGSNGRHALIRMPNGAIERVSAGDHVQGVQVAAIGADSVRLNHRGRDTLLTLPE